MRNYMEEEKKKMIVEDALRSYERRGMQCE
jgi:hypothetical protein